MSMFHLYIVARIILIDRAWLSITPVRSIYIRNCSHHNRGRPNEIELRVVSTDISSTGEDRMRVIVSSCESSSTCCESRTAAADTPDTASSSKRKCLCPSRPANRCAPFRRRVSFSNATVIESDDDHCHCAAIMQDDDLTSTCRDNDRDIENKVERETFYDIWQADDSSTGRSDDGYSENTLRLDNYAEDRRRVSGCTFNSNKGQSSQSENIGEQIVASDGRTQGEWTGNGDVCPTDRLAGNEARNDEVDTVWNEDLSNSTHKNVDSVDRDEYRMRGGWSGCCCGAREKWVKYRCSARTSKYLSPKFFREVNNAGQKMNYESIDCKYLCSILKRILHT